MAADHFGEVVGAPIEFQLTEPGVAQLLTTIAGHERTRNALSVRVGVEAAGHYHRPLLARLHAAGIDVVELNPKAVKDARSQLGHRRLKTDLRDCMAMIELLARGVGYSPSRHSDAAVVQAAWAGQRRRKVEAAQALTNQVHRHADLAFPGVVGCFAKALDARSLRVILHELADPDRVVRLGAVRVCRYVRKRGVRMWMPKAELVVEAARNALRLPAVQRQAVQQLLERDMRLLDVLDAEIAACDVALADALPHTAAGVLVTVPGIGVVSASYYGAALGDPGRFRNADAAYRYSGLVPASYESARRRRGGQRISKEGSVELRQAVLTLGQGLSLHHPDFTAYRRRLLAEGKRPAVASVAVAHRAHRLAFALVRSQQSYDHDIWMAAIAKSRPVTAMCS